MQRCLGIDYGSKRIGIAISDPLNIIARPLKYIPTSSDVKKEFQKLFQEFEVKTIVVGMPYNLKGEKGQAALDVEQFITDVLSHF
jgi:putative Holliday junction resolvase